MSLARRLSAGLLFLLLPVLGCNRAHSRSPSEAAVPRLARLLAELGALEFVDLDEETRPAVLLHPGEVRRCRTDVEAGARLHFSFGILEEGRAQGWLLFRVRANGEPAYELKVSRQRANHWWHASVALPGSGPTTLEFEGVPVEGKRSGTGAPAETEKPWLALGSARVFAPGPRAARRVLVWISQDTVRADHLDTYGYARKTSPTLDRLAADSVLFENGVAAASWTLPSLTAQMTSRYPSRHGATRGSLGRDLSKPTIFEALAAQGFSVFGVTGNHFVSAAYSLAQGFDALWYTTLRADDVNRLALQALEEWEGGDLALFVHYMDPHFGYNPPAPFHEMFTDPGYRGKQQGYDFGKLTRQSDPADIAQVIGLYDGEVAYADQQIGLLLDALRQRVVGDDVVLVYSADHGDEFLDHGGWAHGRQVYEELIHVPFLIRSPGCRPRRVKEVVSLIDLAPTALDALGVPSPASFEGRSLARVLAGGPLAEAPVRSETEMTRDLSQRLALRDGRFKYVLVVPHKERSFQVLSEELYDLEADPHEQSSLASSPRLVAMRQATLAYLKTARAEAAAPNPAVLDAEARDKLRALGYLQ